MIKENKTKLLYWLFTAPIVLLMLVSVYFYLWPTPPVIEAFTHLGYPLYLLKILATAKLLGVAAILYNRNTVLKEWAYAGFTIDFIGAAASHMFSGDDYTKFAFPLILLAILLASYYQWKRIGNS